MKVFEDDHPLLVDHRRNEMMQRKSFYQYVSISAVQRQEYSLKGFSAEMSMCLFFVTSFTRLFVFIRWKILAEGLPHINHFNNASELLAEVRISKKRESELLNTRRMTWVYMDIYESAFEALMSVCCLILYLVFPYCLSPRLLLVVLNSRSRGCLDLKRNGRTSTT